ncbi:MAG: mevalonate kinase, partial [Chloroflexota bacterium]
NLKLLGQLMDQNQNQLLKMDLSSPELDKLIRAAKEAGALGAKLSGGGQGGNIIVLVDESNQDSVQSALKNAGAVSTFSTTIP